MVHLLVLREFVTLNFHVVVCDTLHSGTLALLNIAAHMVASWEAIGATLQIVQVSWDMTLREGLMGTGVQKDVLPSSSRVNRSIGIMFCFSNKKNQVT